MLGLPRVEVGEAARLCLADERGRPVPGPGDGHGVVLGQADLHGARTAGASLLASTVGGSGRSFEHTLHTPDKINPQHAHLWHSGKGAQPMHTALDGL